ncbi:MAG: peptidoglycan bridge formation glycyltransferase FemA/FemB family protein, partial [Oscillospiraceae bacterium]
MEILSKDNYSEFDTFCANHPHGAFQQSPRWAGVKTEWTSEIVVSRDINGQIIGGIFLLIRKMGSKSLMYACRGPVCDYSDKSLIRDLLMGVKELADKYHAYKFVMDPLIMVDDEDTITLFEECGLNIVRNAEFHATIQPRYNYMLRYIKGLSPDELLAKMGRDTRYYIRYSPKKGVVCKNLGLEGLDDFYKIYSDTGIRQNFTVRPKEYFAKMLTSLGDDCRLYMCYYEDTPLCGGVAVNYAGTTSHVYGCSNDEMRNLRPTYLLQWELMS